MWCVSSFGRWSDTWPLDAAPELFPMPSFFHCIPHLFFYVSSQLLRLQSCLVVFVARWFIRMELVLVAVGALDSLDRALWAWFRVFVV